MTQDSENAGCQPSQRVSISFASGAWEVREALAQLKDRLAVMQLGAEHETTVELVVGEVLNNVVEHAYGPGQSGPIEVMCEREEAALHFCVRDSGRAFLGLQLPRGDPPDVDRVREELPEGGFGWYMVRNLACGLGYTRDSDRNTLKFYISLKVLEGESPS
ncbi:ATP-binding protein [Rhodobacteraceae bacterium D3-12]|nr:ATP-binding protein [Rhodobacteraceae bacterium D3-12]